MKKLLNNNSAYLTRNKKVKLLSKKFPTIIFYCRFLHVIFKASSKAKRGKFSYEDLCSSSLKVIKSLNSVGVEFDIKGIENIKQIEPPFVIIANHMSMLETVVMPAVIQQISKVTFVIKQSLLDYPVFKHIMRSYDPIAVSRKNPRQDLKIVIAEGMEKLKEGISIIIFPQTTRAISFDSSKFNTIGIKLAKKSNLPIIPLALLTDAWANGKYLKDFGKIDPIKKVYFSFGKPIFVKSGGRNEHKAVIQFISNKLEKWKDERNKI